MTLSRRELLKYVGVAGMAFSVSSARAGQAIDVGQRPARPTVAIVGSGMAGHAMAWLLDGEFNSCLIEKNDYLGGHCRTLPTQLSTGETINADLGAQFVSPDMHPNYFKLLDLLGISHSMIKNDMTLSMHANLDGDPIFVSPLFFKRMWPLFRTWNLKGLSTFSKLSTTALEFEASAPLPDITFHEFLNSLDISDGEKKRIVLTLSSGMGGCSYSERLEFSARMALAFFSRTVSENPFKAIQYYISKEGLGGNLRLMREKCQHLEACVAESILEISNIGNGYYIKTNKRRFFADHLIFACPPYAVAQLIQRIKYVNIDPLLLRTLDRFRYYSTRLALHTDNIYSHKNVQFRSLYNIVQGEGRAEASVDYGGLFGTHGALYKSWVTDRERSSAEEIVSQSFLHPQVTPDFVRAQKTMEQFQGRNRIWFAGSWTSIFDVDSQDTALMSAFRLAKKIYPDASNFKKFETHKPAVTADLYPA